MKPYIVGISGGSGSGKTFLLKQLLNLIPEDSITLISQDNYYKPIDEQVVDDEGVINYDHPGSLNLDQLAVDIKKIIAGETITLEEYTFNNAEIKPKMIQYGPAPIIIIEGLFVFNLSKLAKMIDLKVFVEAEEYIRLSRRLMRDQKERGVSINEILRDYNKYVAPMYRQHIAPFRFDCDLIIPNNTHMYKAVNILTNHLKSVIND